VPDQPAYRLPRSAIPSRYELTLRPDLDAYTFSGSERVHIEVAAATREITLNAIELEITSAALVSVDGVTRHEGKVTYDENEQQVTVTLDSAIEPGAWLFDASFTGVLNDKLHGFYRSTFVDEQGTERVIATTQFESTDARRAFPCWDEPDFKAAFAVTLEVKDGLTALSNGHVVADDPIDGGYRRVRFAETMTMSTYLVAFVVGPLVVTEDVDAGGTPLRVACVPGKEHLAPFALEAGAHALAFFTDFFGIAYPAGKLDLVALPDFAFGAMENLGCVTFRETALLVDQSDASTTDLMRIADVVAHEIAHMWFGDLVTMKWWNGIWLNEAFATFMELLCVDSFRPEWKRWDAFATERAAALRIDGLEATRPVEIAVARPEEADAMFDVLTYQKGSAVVRMLEQYLGAEAFREGLRLYMQRHAYGNTETTDLWDAIEEASGEPARSIMDSWIYQGGYPLVTATPIGADRVRLSQSRFRYGGGANATWQVPVRVRHTAGEERVVLGDEPVEIAVSGAGPVVVNAGGWGFFRVRYEGDLRGRIAAGLASLSALERYNLLSDAWASALAGAAPATEALELMQAYGDETDPATWQLILAIAKTLRRVAPDHAGEFVGRLAAPAAARYGWEAQEGEDATAGTSRGIVLELLGGFSDDTRASVVKESRRRVEAAESDPAALPGDVRRAALQTVARHGDEADLTRLLEGMRTASTPQDETQYRAALAEFTHPALVRRVCDLCLTEIRSQDVSPLLMLILAGAHPAVAWEWVEANWDTLLERLPSNLVTRIVLGVVETVDQALAARIRAFLETHPIPVGGATVRQYLELMDTHVAFATRESAALASSLGS